ncbi:MAG: hypothetical protein ACLUD0_05860 [Eubacterium ramulus]
MADTQTYLNLQAEVIHQNRQSHGIHADKLVNLTINKVWKDLNNASKLRPDNITVANVSYLARQ